MFILRSENGFSLSEQAALGMVAELMPPRIVENGAEIEAGTDFTYSDAFEDLGDGLFRVSRKVANQSGKRRRIQIIAQAHTMFAPQSYMMPCIMYNGNEWGSRNSPKGLERNGEPWVFAYDRMGIPSCTLTEKQEIGFAMFASNCDRDSLRSSASLIRQGCEFLHRILTMKEMNPPLDKEDRSWIV
ncbi:MAG: hypothetical protein PHI98_02745 [Eubacteriales bacterium]|nr:hypothetical protein [Eubacteriales bacterium]